MNKKIANITIFLNISSLDSSFQMLNKEHSSLKIDYPQLDFIRNFNFRTPSLGIFFSKEEYESYLKPRLTLPKGKAIDKNPESYIDFESFIQLLLSRRGDEKNFLLRSSFLERISKENATLIKKIFELSKFNYKFKIIIEDLFVSLNKDFTGVYYHYSTNFAFIKAESFFKSIFKNRIINFLNGIEILFDIFGKDNISFSYNENSTEETSLNFICDQLDIKKYSKIDKIFIFDEINPLFMEYLKLKIDSNIDSAELKTEIQSIKEASEKYLLKPKRLIKTLSEDSIDFLFKMNEKLISFLPKNNTPIKKNLFIKLDSCGRRHIIPYIDNI